MVVINFLDEMVSYFSSGPQEKTFGSASLGPVVRKERGSPDGWALYSTRRSSRSHMDGEHFLLSTK